MQNLNFYKIQSLPVLVTFLTVPFFAEFRVMINGDKWAEIDIARDS